MNRSSLLDLLRIFAISLVFYAHFGQLLGTAAGDFFGIKNFYYVSWGGVGVSLFLVLSGILAVLAESSRKTGYSTYLIKKILRIYPLYWMSLPLALLGYFVGAILVEGDAPVLFPNGFGTDVFGSLSGFYSWMGLWGGPYNSPSWFIALIMCLYALFPLLYFLIKRQPHFVILLLLAVSVGARLYVGKEGLPLVDQSVYEDIKSWLYRQYGFMPGRPGDWFPPCRVFEFGLGMYLATVLPRSSWHRFKLPFNKPVMLLSDLAFPLFLLHYPFMFLVPYFHELGIPLWISISGFMLGLVLISFVISRIDERIPRRQIMGRFAR